MGLLTLFCVITVAFTDVTSGVGVLPDIVNASVGGTVTFTTSLDPTQTPLLSIIWSFGDTNILSTIINFINQTYEDRITLFNSTGSLELRDLTPADAGDYTVNIISAVGLPLNGETTLKIYEPVFDVTIRANDTDLVEFNSSVSLSCSASGSSPLSYSWFINDSIKVTASDRVHFTDGGANVTIVTAWRSDQGSYTCEVSNPVSSSTSDEELLFVSYGPEDVMLRTSPPSVHHKEGSDVSLSCSADSRPGAQFKWFLNGEMLPSTGAQINLVNIQMDQSGIYSCQAFNNKTLRYTTSQPSKISVLKNITDIFVNTSSDQPIEGTTFNLTCDASGSIHTTNWTLNGAELKPSENIEFYDQQRVLSFRNLTRKDNGKYTCRISNPLSSQSVDYTITVNYGPDSVQISGPVEVQEGTTLKLSCSAESVPTAKYTWTHNGTTVAQSSEYTKDKTVFSDSGEYICQATNDITNKSSEALRTVQVTEIVDPHPCPTGCIIGIVFGCIGVILLVSVAVFCALKKKKKKKLKSRTQTDGEGRDNVAYAQNQEPHYADLKFVKKDGEVVQLGPQNSNTEYSEVRRNNNPLPSYNAHMQRVKRDAPEPQTEYAQVRPK